VLDYVAALRILPNGVCHHHRVTVRLGVLGASGRADSDLPAVEGRLPAIFWGDDK
jgi:hypothetical protein